MGAQRAAGGQAAAVATGRGGVWYRRGGMIVVLPASSRRGSTEQEANFVAETEVGLSYTACDFIDSRIDVSAQRALLRLVDGDAPSRRDGLAMFAAVKGQRLAGIYQQDQKVPALRAQKLGKGWWQLIPAGAGAICVRQPTGELPLIVFQKGLASDVPRLAVALRTAWRQCGLPELAPPPPSGRPCPPRPTPPPPQPAVADVPPPPAIGPPPSPPLAPACRKDEYARRVNQCVEDARRCVIDAHKQLGLELAKCVLNPFCNAKAMGKYLLALKKCRDAIVPCDQVARRDTNCP